MGGSLKHRMMEVVEVHTSGGEELGVLLAQNPLPENTSGHRLHLSSQRSLPPS